MGFAVQNLISEVQPASELKCLLETTFKGREHLQSGWDHALARLGGSIYLTFDWLKTWWEFYGADKRLRLFLFFRDDELVALLPLYLETFGFGPLKTTVARLVGANIPPKTFNPPVDSAWAPQVFARVLQQLFEVDRCDLLSLGPVSGNWSPALALQGVCADARGLVSAAAHQTRDVQTVFQLPPDFDQYLASLGASERKNRLKRLRHLEKNYHVSADIVSDPTLVGQEFDAFLGQHARQWQAVGKGGHFAAWPKGEAYNRALVKAQAGQGRVRFFRMLVNGQVVANRYTFLLGKTLYSELPAREVGEPWDKLGIGAISLLKFNESAIQAGVTTVDSGLGGYEHKAALGGDQVPVGVWRVAGRGVSGVKARLFLGTAKPVFSVCHKLWYRRILPKLPMRFKRTQSLRWLRFDA